MASGRRRARKAAPKIVTVVTRAISSAQWTPPSLAASIAVRKTPKPSAAARPKATLTPAGRVGARPGDSNETSAIPASASAMPALCTGPGSSPRIAAAATGNAGAHAATGATMLIVPTASPR